MATRFSEIAGFLSATLTFTIFPFAAEEAAKGKDTYLLVVKASLANACFCLILAVPFLFFGKTILSILPHGENYSAYWWSIPWLIGITYLTSIIGIYATVELSANRFGFLKLFAIYDFIYPVLLLLVSGHNYFQNYIPASWSEFLTIHNIYSLKTMLGWITLFNFVKASSCIILIAYRHKCHLNRPSPQTL